MIESVEVSESKTHAAQATEILQFRFSKRAFATGNSPCMGVDECSRECERVEGSVVAAVVRPSPLPPPGTGKLTDKATRRSMYCVSGNDDALRSSVRPSVGPPPMRRSARPPVRPTVGRRKKNASGNIEVFSDGPPGSAAMPASNQGQTTAVVTAPARYVTERASEGVCVRVRLR